MDSEHRASSSSSCWCCPDCIQSKPATEAGADSDQACNGVMQFEPTDEIFDDCPLSHVIDDEDDDADDDDACDEQLANGEQHIAYCRMTSQSSISSALSSSMKHVMNAMKYHPKYLKCFQRTHYYLMHEDGSLPFEYRHYIAIMAAARHHCAYLVETQKVEFLQAGGDQRWLEGLQQAPRKLSNLYEVNKILAHRPWMFDRKHIESLRRGPDSWSLSELAHALVVLAHFHALSTFVLGCGINLDVDCSSSSESSSGHCSGDDSRRQQSLAEVDSGIELLIERMKALSQVDVDDMSVEELAQRFEAVKTSSVDVNKNIPVKPVKEEIRPFVSDIEFTYEDFGRQSTGAGVATFRVQDYSWEEHGYSLANELYDDIAVLLDDKFQMTQKLTYYTMGPNKDIDTTSFRSAVWHYVHCIYGIRHDDYNYGAINDLLEKSVRCFVKLIACFPAHTIRKDYKHFMTQFMQSEKVHVIIMSMEARLQAELLYSLRAISRAMT